jgi:hypothetical protein
MSACLHDPPRLGPGLDCADLVCRRSKWGTVRDILQWGGFRWPLRVAMAAVPIRNVAFGSQSPNRILVSNQINLLA